MKKFEVEKTWSWRNLKLMKFKDEKFEVEEIWSWRNLKLTNFNLKNLKLKKFEVGVRFKTFLEHIYVDNQLWFWKYSPIFLFSISPHFGPLLHFFGAFRGYLMVLWGYFMALWDYYWGGVRFKTNFWNLPMKSINFGFGSTALSFLFLIRPNLGPFLHFWGLSGLFLGLGSGSKTFLGLTYID